MNKKQWVKDYLVFSKKERIGIYCILAFVFFFSFYPTLFTKKHSDDTILADTALAKMIDTLQLQENSNQYSKDESSYSYEPSSKTKWIKGELFTFDPNTVSSKDWSRLGLQERTINTIMNYRNKGGKFYKPEDLRKIWGLPEGFYKHVSSHIQITSLAQLKHNNSAYTSGQYQENKERKIKSIDINNADTTALIALQGIGSKLALRIVNFRDKLGGFHSIEQLKETYGLPDSTFQKLKPYLQTNITQIKRLNINAATKEELKTHPYIRWQLANVIVEYRNQHGNYKNLLELKNIHLIDEAAYTKMAPYLDL